MKLVNSFRYTSGYGKLINRLGLSFLWFDDVYWSVVWRCARMNGYSHGW